MNQSSTTLAFVSIAYNEADNIQELYQRCRIVFEALQHEYAENIFLEFRFLVADNCSTDNTLEVLTELGRKDPAVVVLANQMNYGGEASGGNVLDQARNYDLTVFLCSDLQDPPEIALEMVRSLVEHPELDAVLAVKKRSAGGPMLRLARRIYYQALGLSSRHSIVPSGFHGFGCYRQSVIEEAVCFWKNSDINLRQCLTNACQLPLLIYYHQPDRMKGTSSYQGLGYLPEALRALISGDAAGSRLALVMSLIGMALSTVIGVFLLLNFLSGRSTYSSGIPTVMGLVLISFAMQMLMIALLSRQIEGLRMGGFRRKVFFRQIGDVN